MYPAPPAPFPGFLDPALAQFADLQAHRRRQRSPSVLVVDTDQRERETLAYGLTRYRLNALMAVDGRDAVQACKSGPAIDVVVTAEDMLGMGGLETLAEVRRVAPWVRCCLIIHRGHYHAAEA